MTNLNGPDIIIPLAADLNWLGSDDYLKTILYQHREYGFTRFCLCLPCAGMRSTGYPSREYFIEKAGFFNEIKKSVSPMGIELGWCHCLTIKSGVNKDFKPIVKQDGEKHPFANCPLDENFKNRFSEDIALFAEIAKPAFIFLEDDFSLAAAFGCYCDDHLRKFEKRYGLKFTREELISILNEKSPVAFDVTRKWKELAKSTLSEFAKAIREEVNKKTPEIPIGTWQSGGDYVDGFCTEEICRSISGENHIPYTRFSGADYSGMKSKDMPIIPYMALFCRQHLNNFKYYLEADTYPHTRFFTSGKQITSLMTMGFAYGFDGAIFHSNQHHVDNPNEETAYGKAYRREAKRFKELYVRAKECRLKGVEIGYVPFPLSLEHTISPWLNCISRFAVPYTTLDSPVKFCYEKQIRNYDDRQIRNVLSDCLFLDGAAARYLCEKGYGEYLGVRVGDDISKKGRLIYDLGAREVICDEFSSGLEGQNMFPAWMFSPGGNGIALELAISDPCTKVVTQVYDHRKKFVTNGMTYYENKLGGKIIVMGMTVENNNSQTLYNYRRQYIIQQLIEKCCDIFCYVKKAPNVVLIENEAAESADFREMLTLINLCEDSLDEIIIHIPKTLEDFEEIHIMDYDGKWRKADFVRKDDSVVLSGSLECLEATHLMIK